MKTRFNTLDICAVLAEINERAIGMRLANVYDIDNKTYLFKLAKPEQKAMLLVESGIRMHLSEFDWPKNPMPSGFSMKMRKHLRGRRLVAATQLGMDRIIDLQFGSSEAAYHVFIELYDRGNIALADFEYTILNLLRFRKDTTFKTGDGKTEENDDVRVAVHEPYPIQAARPVEPLITFEKLQEILNCAKNDSPIKRILNPHLPYGASCIEHCLSTAGFSINAKLGKDFNVENDAEKLHVALAGAEEISQNLKLGKCKGFVIQKREKKSDGEMMTNIEFHPFLFEHHKVQPYREFESFNKAVDEFFGTLEAQKNDMKALQRERAAMRKLDNVRRDHEARLQGLRTVQDEDKRKAWIIEANLDLVDQASKVICTAIANQVDWSEIKSLVTDAQARDDKVAMAIKNLKLETNTMTMSLSEPEILDDEEDDSDFMESSDDEKETLKKSKVKSKPVKVEIDLSLSAYANAQQYYNKKRHAAQKEKRTLDASTKAFKSAEKKTKQSLKEAAAIQIIQKARKVFWFEKFLWFISSENYLVLGGRDAQQNEILVKKYLNTGDIYVHADLHGATSCIIKNPTGSPVPPKTLNESGTMAICHSAAWDAKVVTSAWWVHSDQVSKTAPSGEYLTTGSFLIRGKKNYLPPSYLVYGFGFLFKIDETCVWKHKGERRVRLTEDDSSTVADSNNMEELALMSDEDVDDNDVVVHELNVDNALESDNLQAGSTPLPESVESGSENDKVTGSDDGETQVDIDEKSGTAFSNFENKKSDENEITEINDKIDDSVGEGVSVGSDDKDNPSGNVTVDYPDTVTKMHYKMEDKYDLSNLTSNGQSEETTDDLVVYLGDDIPVSLKKGEQCQSKPRMSAKQRRDLKKKKLESSLGDDQPPASETTESANQKKEKKTESQPQQQEVVLKRGQKKKLHKMKEKYKDQDEEDRQLMMELLQSAKGPKDKKNKKGKNKQQDNRNKNQGQKPKLKDESVGVKAVQSEKGFRGENREKPKAKSEQKEDSDEEREMVLKAEHLNVKEVDDILDSLTGVPNNDDVLLFAIPVCAPYNTMQSYKFKVKLTPGTGKKGKAAKTAISMFHLSRDTTQQEKDHLRSVKDHDLSRNMPGKVKVSAPNLQKQKFKGKKR